MQTTTEHKLTKAMTPKAMTPETLAEPAKTAHRGEGRRRMKAVAQDRYGTSEVLATATIDRPLPGPTDVVIEVRAAGLDRGVEHMMTGTPYLIRLMGFGLLRPKNRVLGLDVAGVVVEVGSAVTKFLVGDEVFGIGRGAYAEYALADQAKLAIKPANLSFEEAAVSTVSGITALQALTDVGSVQAGQRVLVVGASGGVGTFAVQLAVAMGAVVDGVAGTNNLDFVRSLGARRVHDHRVTALADIDERYDLILDIGGRNHVRSLRGLLTDSGTLVIVGGEGGGRFTGGIGRQLRAVALSPFVKQRLTMFLSTEHHSFIERLCGFLEDGTVVPSIEHRFGLDDVAMAMGQLAAGEIRGKAAILIGADERPVTCE